MSKTRHTDYPLGYRRIKNTGRGHEWYGKCERCGKHCSQHYKQQKRTAGGWLNAGFGHVECLQNDVWKGAHVDHDPD